MRDSIAKAKTGWLVGVLCLALSAIYSVTAAAQESVDKHLSVSSDVKVVVENVRGKLVVQPGADDDVHVQGTLDEDTKEFIFKQSGDTVYLKVKIKQQSGWHNWGNSDKRGSNLTLTIPASASISVQGVSMDTEINDIKGGTSIELVSGDVRASQLAKQVSLSTVSGDIHSVDMRGDVRLESVSGNIEDTGSSGDSGEYSVVSGDLNISSQMQDVILQSVSGDIRASLGSVKKLELSTVSGDTSAEFTLLDGGDIEASSVSGEMTLNFVGEVNAAFDINANAGGDIQNMLSSDEPREAKYGPASSLEFSVGNGSASVDINTVSGDIRVRPAK
ncbi:hypothetical protein CWI84_11095 [Idiomarina tyrosinivorans]|uniref:DUF4097 domain-containing protein n=1 Tax=Idiomarina tyrosinivorans TaxID=1445662 RepID=A0A432ZG05_9GAMM|nr:DUF4097 family beta strand repeat-containing protein [Idiomarina tyrosinivorans]RUO76896.1 hypothetical protein CWI84_11095 [Idiomarina tyrosinivorans]